MPSPHPAVRLPSPADAGIAVAARRSASGPKVRHRGDVRDPDAGMGRAVAHQHAQVAGLRGSRVSSSVMSSPRTATAVAPVRARSSTHRRVLALVAVGVLDDVVAGAPAPLRAPRRRSVRPRRAGGLGVRGARQPGAHCQARTSSARSRRPRSARLRRSPRPAGRRVERRRRDRRPSPATFAGKPVLGAVRPASRQGESSLLFGDDPQVVQRAAGNQRHRSVGQGREPQDGERAAGVIRTSIGRSSSGASVPSKSSATSRCAVPASTSERRPRSIGLRSIPATARAEESRCDQSSTSFSRTFLRRARMRRPCSPGFISTARMIASFSPSMSCGLTSTACRSSSAAPANSLSTSTPSSSNRQATYSLATRFMPSRSAVTSMTSAAR